VGGEARAVQLGQGAGEVGFLGGGQVGGVVYFVERHVGGIVVVELLWFCVFVLFPFFGLFPVK
jgi:hypothetical protein